MKSSRERSGWPVMVLIAASLVLLGTAAAAQDEPPVVVTVTVAGNAVPGGVATARAAVEINDGSMVTGYAWTQTGGVAATITGANTANVRVRLAARGTYRAELVHILSEPPIGPAQLPPNVPVPEEFVAGLQNRWQVVGINPFALEEAALVAVEVEVTTTSGTYRGEAEIHTVLPWKMSTGIRNVPIRVPVLLQGKEQDSYNWRLTVPDGSGTALAAHTSRNPEFVPDIPGIYTVQVRDLAAEEQISFKIYAGTWRGIIVAQDDDGRPVPEGLCTACHQGAPFAPDFFTPWAQTGHAEIFTQNLNTNSHYSTSCFGCHTVGYDPGPGPMNHGIDEAPDFQAFLNSGLIDNPGDNWTQVLERFPDTAQMANIQCENCHGPQSSEFRLDTLAHGWRSELMGDEPRVSLSADVCGSCHGEPLRHARFQQWQLSRHSNYELAIDEGDSGSCSRCHTANGFLTWLPILLGDEPGDPTANIEVTWTSDETHPQTCQTCHDPHAIGTTSGDDPNARVRISGDTPTLIAGFKVIGAGKGAICMTCHNSRRGLKNDATFADFANTSETARAPHGSSQTDMLMGENAFFVNVGVRGPHSFIEDTCVTCHMEKTPPPELLSYNQGGTNHTFFASPDICSECHSEIIDADVLQRIVDSVMANVQELIEQGWIDEFAAQIAAGNTIDLDGDALVTDADDIESVELGESRGRQALTVTLTNGMAVGPVAISSIDVVQPAPLPAVAITTVGNQNLLKAGWNWFLVHNDGSRGVHNPTFTLAALDGARDAVGGIGGPRTRLPF